jgi:hypothetical protein
MNLVLLLPACIALALVLQGKAEKAFLWVYLPTLLLLPQDYSVKLPHLPPTSAAEFTIIPIGCAGLFRLIRSGSISLMDILIFLYACSITATEVLQERKTNDGIFFAANACISIIFAYMAGRKLIEPLSRIVTVRWIVLLFLFTIPLGVFEWRFGLSLYGIVGQKILFLSSVHPGVVIRDGRGRLGAAFTNSEIAGIAFGITMCLNAWLVYLNRTQRGAVLGKQFALLEKYHIPGLLFLITIWLTQSRGPLMSLGAAYLIVQIPRFKNTRLASLVVALILGLGALGVSQYFAHYTSVSYDQIKNEQQGSAIYRSEMNVYFQPVAEKGGWLGWGAFQVPAVRGQVSIDNEFLRVHLVQGKFGYYVLLLIAAESIRVLLVRSWKMRSPEDRSFVFSMLGAMAILWITLYTVYMGAQLPQFAFLLLGWCQSISPTADSTAMTMEAVERPRFEFQRVFH